jgi:hypothetical protein
MRRKNWDTPAAKESRWMPWELGYMDGNKSQSAILPISSTDEYNGREYLSVYPYVVRGTNQSGKELLWIHEDKTFVSFDRWMAGAQLGRSWARIYPHT